MSGNKRQNPNIEDFARKNATLIAKHVEENPNNGVVIQYPPRMYKCKNCDKKYDNFQALGGHRASHRSSLKTVTSETDSEIKKHECRICGDGFAVGQALGGHMRKHWVPKVAKKGEKKKVLSHGNKNLGNIKNSKTAMVVPYDHDPDESCSSSSSVTSNSKGKEVFAYDLNLTPCENEELKNGVRSDNGDNGSLVIKIQ